MLRLVPRSLLLLSLALAISAQTNCPSACFQGTPESAGPPVDDSYCPPAAGIVNPFYTPNCLCYTPETYDGSAWLFCYTCGGTGSGDFADICGTTQVDNTCPNQDDGISQACNGASNINDVLGKFCNDGKPTALVTGITEVVTFLEPELADGAIELAAEACTEAKGAQTVTGAASQFCSIWQTAGCGTVNAAASTGSGSTGSSTSASEFLDRPKTTYATSLIVTLVYLLLL